MISIIISSYQQSYFSAFESNVAETIGVAYEVIQIKNPGLMGICQAYNRGLQQSQYGCVLFCHEDILFKTQDWGKELINVFETDPAIGLVGIAGSTHASRFPSPWWEHGRENNIMNMLHSQNNEADKIFKAGWESSTENIRDVAVIDGVFIGMRKSAGITFNEQLIGFHNYDLGISIDFKAAGWRVVCTKNILLQHFSEGKLDAKWSKLAYNYYALYHQKLPIIPAEMPDKRAREIDKQDARFVMNKTFKYKQYREFFFFWKKSFYLNPLPIEPSQILKSLFKKRS